MFPEDRFVEFLIIGALALIVIGPKDLPILMRRIGQFVGKMRGMAAEFRASFDELARQSELDELRREVEALRHSQTSIGEPAQPMRRRDVDRAPALDRADRPRFRRRRPSQRRPKAAKTMGEAP